jgi:DNA repair photolyase
LENGPKNKNPKTPLAWALKQKKTIKIGNKSDPFQDAEKELKITHKALRILVKNDWSFVIQTRHTETMMDSWRFLIKHKRLATIMPVISPGLEKDWELFERKRTTNPIVRLEQLKVLRKAGMNVGVNGEPFIPGFHTVKDFENALKLLKEYKIKSYNTYNFHFNAYVAKRMVDLPGVDIEKIWTMNQDKEWRKILKKLLILSEKYKITLGCPDFVNSGRDWKEKANTCCGVDVPNPCTFNTHYFKKYKQEGKSDDEIFDLTYDGTGPMDLGRDIIEGNTSKFYTMDDAGSVD